MEKKNKIYQLLDEKFVIDYFNKVLMPKYPVFEKITKISITTPKKHIWIDDYYHVVIKYRVFFLMTNKKRKRLTFYAVAHSSELRKNVYDILRFLWTHDFNKGYLTIPHPICYSKHFNASFYRGVDGHHLFYYMLRNDLVEVEKIVKKTAKWFAKLHKLDRFPEIGVNHKNNRISTVVPGINSIFYKMDKLYPEFIDNFKKVYNIIILKEDKHFRDSDDRCLVHGDAHPENIIRMSEKKLAFIDFSDMCWGDFTRDLGTFLQQLEYMMPRGEENEKFVIKMKDTFLDTYFEKRGVELTEDIRDRIDNYYDWTMLRTATYFFIKEDRERDTGEVLLDRLKTKLIDLK